MPQSYEESVYSKQEILKAFCGYVQHNWHASLGWGEDREILERAAEDNEWVLDFLSITPAEFIKFFEEVRYEP